MPKHSKQAWIWRAEQSQRAARRQKDGEEPQRQISTGDGIIKRAAEQGMEKVGVV